MNRHLTEKERFEAKFRPSSKGCWTWTANWHNKGYGLFKSLGKTVKAHRFSYELYVGPIPEGLQIDHLCRNRTCVNPAHLEPVTNSENLLRSNEHRARASETLRKASLARRKNSLPEGVYQCKDRFAALVRDPRIGRQRKIGVYETAEDAHMAYIAEKAVMDRYKVWWRPQ